MKEKLENMEQSNNDEKEKTPTLYEFVDAIFIAQGERNSHGDIRIEMDGSPRFLIVHLYYDRDKDSVEVKINNVIMGKFTPYTGQGYKYQFLQHYRKYIRNGRTMSEQFMEDICINNDWILLRKVY